MVGLDNVDEDVEVLLLMTVVSEIEDADELLIMVVLEIEEEEEEEEDDGAGLLGSIRDIAALREPAEPTRAQTRPHMLLQV